MIKTKEDDFLGDEITNNIKRADNVWQAQGTVDRGSSYTKESILHLLLEGLNYDKEIGDYKDYVARASTSVAANENYIPAKFQHDIYVLDSQYYTSTAVFCSKNIFDIDTYLQKAFSIANPVYDDKAKSKVISIFDIKKNEAGEFEGSALNETLFDLFKYFMPEFYADQSITAETSGDKLIKIIEHYTKPYPDSGYSSNIDPGVVINASTTLGDFLNYLTLVTNKSGKTAADCFLEDFTLHAHDTESIKMPFYNRGKTTITNEDETTSVIEETVDERTFKTRFIANSITESLYNTENLVKAGYVENLNDLVEEAIYANNTGYSIYDARANTVNALKTDTDLAKEVLRSTLNNPEDISTKYQHLFSIDDRSSNTQLETFVGAIDSIDTYISLYCPDVFINYNVENNPINSWGIHFFNEEPTENLFQDVNKAYKLYNTAIVGYKLADTLLAYRTFAGGLYYLISQYHSAEELIPLDTPLLKRVTNTSFYDNDVVTSGLNFYPTLTAINALYRIGHGLDVSLNELQINEGYIYNFEGSEEVKDWLANECFIFKGTVYGDYVEELNFMQDLTPDSDVHFNSLRLKKTEIPYRRYQDSKYEVPYVEQTIPLLNSSKNEKGLDVFGSDALSGLGNLLGAEVDENGNATRNSIPPFLYDFDKGDQEFAIADVVDDRQKSNGNAQRVNAKNNKGSLVVEDRITSPTIDELWTFLKYLTESDGSGTDKDVNERLPQFYGIKKDLVKDTISVSTNNPTNITKNVINPRALEEDHQNVIDVLNWEPVSIKEARLHWSPSENNAKTELQFGGYKITKYIEKIYDYEVKPFSRRVADIKDNDTYEYNTEVSSDKNNVTGYLEKIYNSAILAFDLPEVSSVEATTAFVNTGILLAEVLGKDDYKLVGGKNRTIFSAESDSNLITPNKPLHATVQREKAFEDVSNILNYHNSDGVTATASLHNHYKKYLANPKNLKEIERDLETIRQNLQTLAEFIVVSYPNMGYADRAQNRGTIHQLHKNAYEFLSTYLANSNNTKATASDEIYDVAVKLDNLVDTLNNLEDTLEVVDLDKKVVFEDGNYQERYLRDNYDRSVIDLNSNTKTNSRAYHYMYRPNETLLSETYLAADGTWRSIHEHTVLPVLYSEH